MTLSEALQARRNGRRNPSRRPARRRNPGNMTLREALAMRNNPVSRTDLRTDVANARAAYKAALDEFESDSTPLNRRILARQKRALEDLQRELKSTAANLRGKKAPAKKASRKSSTRKSAAKKSTAKKSTAKKSTAKKSTAKKGVASQTAAYKALRARSTKSRFTRAFNETFKKQKRSGKSVASAQRSAIAAGKRAVARKNPASAQAESVSAVAANALRSNPRKAKKSKKKASSSRKPKTAAAIAKHARSTKLYKRLRSASKKKEFLAEFAKAFRAQNRKRGVTEAQAVARAALSAFAKTKSATSSKSSTRKSATKKSTRRTTRKSTTRKRTAKKSTRSSSSRASSLTAAAKKSAFYKKLRSSAKKAAFVREFKAVHAKIARKANSAAQANARAALSAYAKVNKSSSRKNPLRMDVPRDNPRKRRKSTRRASSTKRARAKRLKGGMRKSAMQVLSKYGPYTYRVMINGKVTELKASKSSSVYKQAKKGGLKAVKLAKLRGKKNTPTSLNLRSVYKTVDGRPSKKDFQRAINAWAGALDGGKIRGVSKKDIARTRMNPKTLRKHTVSALANPAPMSESFRTRLMERANAPTSTMDKVKLGGLGVGSYAFSLYASTFLSSLAGDRLGHRAVGEGLPVAAFVGIGGYGLYRKFVQKANVSDQIVAVCGGFVAGSVTSLIARTLAKGLGRMIPGFERITSAPGDNVLATSGYLLDNQSHSNLQGLDDMSRLYGTHGVGRFVHSPAPANMGSVIRTTPNTGRYLQMGQYIPYPSAEQLGGVYKHEDGTVHHGDTHMRSNPIMPGRISPVGANTQMVPNRASAVPAGMYDINFRELQEDLNLQEPLGQDDLNAEGLVEVYANGMQMRIIRCTPDVARQVAEANMGSIVGESRVVPGSILVLANTFDTPQNHALTDRLRLNRAPEIPKGASYPQAGGVFSRVAFSSLFPSVDNQASFQEFGVRLK